MDPVGEGRSPSVAFFWTLRMGEIPLSSPGNGDGIATIPSVGLHLSIATKTGRLLLMDGFFRENRQDTRVFSCFFHGFPCFFPPNLSGHQFWRSDSCLGLELTKSESRMRGWFSDWLHRGEIHRIQQYHLKGVNPKTTARISPRPYQTHLKTPFMAAVFSSFPSHMIHIWPDIPLTKPPSFVHTDRQPGTKT